MYQARLDDKMRRALRQTMLDARARWELTGKRCEVILRPGHDLTAEEIEEAIQERETALAQYRRAFHAYSRSLSTQVPEHGVSMLHLTRRTS